jgi:hypothetical protein
MRYMNINTFRDAWILLFHHCYTSARVHTHTHTHSYCIQTENLFINKHSYAHASIN